MMKRREFGGTLAGGIVGAGVAASPAAAQAPRARRKNTLMHVGGDYHSVAGSSLTSKENLEYNLRYGVKHLTVQPWQNRRGGGETSDRSAGFTGLWDLDGLKRMKDDCDKYGVTLEGIRMDANYIQLPKGPARDRELDIIFENIQKASQVGAKVVSYHWTVIPIRRNRQTPGRGGVTYAGFKLEDNWKELPVGEAGKVSSEDYWERITYFLQKVVPVARQHDVRMACHPYDPPGLPFGYQGAENWDSPSIFEALKRYESVVDSPYNGFQLCLGTTSEGLKNPGVEILPIVQYLGERGKLYQIHMRNIRGHLYDFEEVYPDEGELDFFKIMRILRDVQFAGSIMPDHMPRHPGDPRSLQSYAFGYGYLGAMIRAVNSEVEA
jgi:mannonate dehydratase